MIHAHGCRLGSAYYTARSNLPTISFHSKSLFTPRMAIPAVALHGVVEERGCESLSNPSLTRNAVAFCRSKTSPEVREPC
jgi:hypothetical protein